MNGGMSTENISSVALKIFYCAFALSQACGVAALGLVINSRKGKEKAWFWHPVLAVLGLVILQGESLMIFRILRGLRKSVSKAVHASLHFTAFACVIAALVLIFKEMGGFHIPSSFHGRLGLLSVTLFLTQYIVAFTVFLAPGAAGHIRARLLPIHVFGGMLIFVLSCVTPLLNISSDFPAATLIVLYAISVSVVVCFKDFRRRPIPEDNERLYINGSVFSRE